MSRLYPFAWLCSVRFNCYLKSFFTIQHKNFDCANRLLTAGFSFTSKIAQCDVPAVIPCCIRIMQWVLLFLKAYESNFEQYDWRINRIMQLKAFWRRGLFISTCAASVLCVPFMPSALFNIPQCIILVFHYKYLF